MNTLPAAAALAPKRKEAEIAHTSPHPAHSVRSVDGMMDELNKAEWMDSTPPGETLPQLPDAAAALAAAAEPPAGPALPLVPAIDVDAIPDPADRTNSNVTVDNSMDAAAAIAAIDAEILNGVTLDDEEEW